MKTLIEDLHKKIAQVLEIKDQAINDSVAISDELFERINQIKTRIYFNRESWEEKSIVELDTEVDKLKSKLLSEIKTSNPIITNDASYSSITVLFLSGLIVITSFLFIIYGSGSIDSAKFPTLQESLISIFLGLSGAIVFFIFRLLGISNYKVQSRFLLTEIVARIVLAGLIGFVFYLAFYEKFGDSEFLLIFPFLAGFSIKLVVGIINQALKAIEVVFGIKDVPLISEKKKID